MEFLGIGYQELLLVLVLMLVFVGPERLPNMAYQIGRAVRTLQQYARQVRDEFGDEINYLEEQVRTVRGEVNAAASELREQSSKFNSELRDATAPITQELRQATEPLSIAPASTVPSEASVALANGISANGVALHDTSPIAAFEAPAANPQTPQQESKGDSPPLVF